MLCTVSRVSQWICNIIVIVTMDRCALYRDCACVFLVLPRCCRCVIRAGETPRYTGDRSGRDSSCGRVTLTTVLVGKLKDPGVLRGRCVKVLAGVESCTGVQS